MPSLFAYVKTTIQRIRALIKKHPYLTASLASLAIIIIGYAVARSRSKSTAKLQVSYLSDFMEALRNDLVKEVTTKSRSHLEYVTKDGRFLTDGSLIPKAELFRLISLKQIAYKDSASSGNKEVNDLIAGLVFFLTSLGFSLFLVLRKTASDRYKFNDENQAQVRFRDIFGLDKAKLVLQETIDYLADSEKYEQLGCRLRKGIIFYGPPGTGKTMLAKAMAAESRAQFISSSASEFCEMYVGVGPKRIRQLFADAKRHKSAVIFIDEIDALGRKEEREHDKERNNTLNELLVQMDGFVSSGRVVVIAATNRIEMIDSALLRSGRFDLKIEVPMPSEEERKGILQLHLAKKPADVSEQFLDKMASKTKGMCGADLENLTNEAAYKALRKQKKQISE